MAKKKGNVYGQVVVYEKTYKGTSIGRRPNTSTMNKNKRRSYKKYRGQGKWVRDQCSIPMESLFHIKCHRIIDHQQVEVAVGHAVCSAKNLCSAVYLELKESEILMFVINGDQEDLKDNGRTCPLFSIITIIIWWSDD